MPDLDSEWRELCKAASADERQHGGMDRPTPGTPKTFLHAVCYGVDYGLAGGDPVVRPWGWAASAGPWGRL